MPPLRYGVVAAVVPRPATANSPRREPGSAPWTVKGECLVRILRATRVESAARRKHRADGHPVSANDESQERCDHDFPRRTKASRSCQYMRAVGTMPNGGRTKTSIGPSPWCSARNASRILRLMEFRTFARAECFLETSMPRRAGPVPRLESMNVNPASLWRVPSRRSPSNPERPPIRRAGPIPARARRSGPSKRLGRIRFPGACVPAPVARAVRRDRRGSGYAQGNRAAEHAGSWTADRFASSLPHWQKAAIRSCAGIDCQIHVFSGTLLWITLPVAGKIPFLPSSRRPSWAPPDSGTCVEPPLSHVEPLGCLPASSRAGSACTAIQHLGPRVGAGGRAG